MTLGLLDLARIVDGGLLTLVERVPVDFAEVERHLDLPVGTMHRVAQAPHALAREPAGRLAEFLAAFVVEGRPEADFVDACVQGQDRLFLRCPVCLTLFQLGGVSSVSVVRTRARDAHGSPLGLAYYWGKNKVSCPAAALQTGRTVCSSQPSWWTPKPLRLHADLDALEKAPKRFGLLLGA